MVASIPQYFIAVVLFGPVFLPGAFGLFLLTLALSRFIGVSRFSHFDSSLAVAILTSRSFLMLPAFGVKFLAVSLAPEIKTLNGYFSALRTGGLELLSSWKQCNWLDVSTLTEQGIILASLLLIFRIGLEACTMSVGRAHVVLEESTLSGDRYRQLATAQSALLLRNFSETSLSSYTPACSVPVKIISWILLMDASSWCYKMSTKHLRDGTAWSRISWDWVLEYVSSTSNAPHDVSQRGLELDFSSCTGLAPNFDSFFLSVRVQRDFSHVSTLNLVSCLHVRGDIAVFSCMVHLRRLFLDQTCVNGDIQFVTTLPYLLELGLDNTRVHGDITVFSANPGITDLFLAETQVSGDLRVFSTSFNLRRLCLPRTHCEGDIWAFRDSARLEVLELGGTSCWGTLSVFSPLKRLRVLVLENTQAGGNLSAFREHYALSTLVLSGTHTEGNLMSLSNAKHLKKLLAGNTCIDGNVAFLADFPNLEMVALQCTHVEVYQGCPTDGDGDAVYPDRESCLKLLNWLRKN
jgi:hypothetical protein